MLAEDKAWRYFEDVSVGEKRKSNLKDTSDFLPGHGGILDRVDGILIGIPIGFFTLVMTY